MGADCMACCAKDAPIESEAALLGWALVDVLGPEVTLCEEHVRVMDSLQERELVLPDEGIGCLACDVGSMRLGSLHAFFAAAAFALSAQEEPGFCEPHALELERMWEAVSLGDGGGGA